MPSMPKYSLRGRLAGRLCPQILYSRERWTNLGVEIAGGGPEIFAARIKRDTAKWAEVIKRAGVVPEAQAR